MAPGSTQSTYVS